MIWFISQQWKTYHTFDQYFSSICIYYFLKTTYFYIIVNLIFLLGASCLSFQFTVDALKPSVQKSNLTFITYSIEILLLLQYISTSSYRFIQDSIMSLDISFSRVSRCLPNSSSGQWRSLMKVCRASSFQKRSSDVPEPLLQVRI